jgi:hypothetical protein
MAKKKRPKPKVTKAAGAWEITELGDTEKHPWAGGLPVGAAFSIDQDAKGTITFIAGEGCSGIFKGARKRMTDIGAGLSKLRQFHDDTDVTEDSFCLTAILARKTFIFAGYQKKSRRRAAPATGLIEIYPASAAMLTALRNPGSATRVIKHGGPHGEPKKTVAVVGPDGGKPHKLVGRWRITTPGGSAFPWSSGLPIDATFETTSDLKFVPGQNCTGKFRRSRKLRRAESQGSQAGGGDDSLRMTLDNQTDVTLSGGHKDLKKVSITGPGDLSLKRYGGPSGEPE